MQAADLIVGDLLLTADGQWAEVVESKVTNQSLVAYNLDVAVVVKGFGFIIVILVTRTLALLFQTM